MHLSHIYSPHDPRVRAFAKLRFKAHPYLPVRPDEQRSAFKADTDKALQLFDTLIEEQEHYGETMRPQVNPRQVVPAERQKVVFLGYPFALDYIRPAVERAAEGLATILVASDTLRGQPLLQKIEAMMGEADLSLFDLTLHNANVAAEFGIAHGKGLKYAILYCTDESLNPTPGHDSSLFTDLRGWDSLLYGDASELEDKLRKYLPGLLALPVPTVPAPLHMRQADEERERRDRAFAVQPIMHLRLGSGEGGPQGSFVNGVIRNVGRGIALKPKLFLPGFGDVSLDHLIKPTEERPIRLRYDDKPFYTTPLADTIARVEFEDEFGNRYEQIGSVSQLKNANSSVLGYGIPGLDQATPIASSSGKSETE